MIGRAFGGMKNLATGGARVSRNVAMNRMVPYAKKHPMRAGAMGLGAAGGIGYMQNRRGRGVDKAGPGRPTGMYRY